MGRRIIRTKKWSSVTYLGRKYIVVDLYPHVAQLEDEETHSRNWVCLGDLVIAGLEPQVLSGAFVK